LTLFIEKFNLEQMQKSKISILKKSPAFNPNMLETDKLNANKGVKGDLSIK
jgi:hypothetical protein